jgi:hypothetical protein
MHSGGRDVYNERPDHDEAKVNQIVALVCYFIHE